MGRAGFCSRESCHLVYQEKSEPFAPERFIREDLEAGAAGIREVSREYLDYAPATPVRKRSK